MREEYISKKQLTHTKINKNGEESFFLFYFRNSFVWIVFKFLKMDKNPARDKGIVDKN